MSQNRSSAVMAQRNEPTDSLDFFPTPPWATRAATEWLRDAGLRLSKYRVWDPCCGECDMARPLAEDFMHVHASDVHAYGKRQQEAVHDFTSPADGWKDYAPGVDWIFMNPPFNLAETFIRIALGEAVRGVAAFVRLAFLESEGRYQRLWRQHPPTSQLLFPHRPVLAKGRLRDPDIEYVATRPDGRKMVQKPSSATAYTWLIWDLDGGATLRARDWVGVDADDRRRLTRPGDYPPLPEDERVPIAA